MSDDRFIVQNVGEDRVHKKTRWNLYNSAHKVPSQKYKDNYDRIFRKEDGGEKKDLVDRLRDDGN